MSDTHVSGDIYANGVKLTGNPSQAAISNVTQANAATQTGAYVQADAQSIAALANANKGAINQILAALRAAGIITT